MLGGAPALFRLSAAGVTDQDAPHHLGGDAEELGAILPVDLVLIDEPEINLVHQRGRLEGVIGAFPAEEADGLAVQLFVDQRKQRLERVSIARGPGNQPSGHLAPVWHLSRLRKSGIV
jgi:hypothetical protein